MDVAYDHIQEETLSPEANRSSTPTGNKDPNSSTTTKPNLNAEFQETFKAFSSSPWGARLGGFLGNVKKQGESYYEGARQEYTAASEEALKGFTDLRATIVNRTRSLSLGETLEEKKADLPAGDETDDVEGAREAKQRSESQILQDKDGLISRFRSEAAKRLKDIEKAEDAADEALLRFGTNIRNFLRDAVAIAPPSEENKDAQGGDEILFESKNAEGKRVIHTTRFDAQLHVIHSSLDSFSKDPVSSEWPKWKEDFKVDEKTGDIGKDLEKYVELRRGMERLVPEKVEYADFWRRYYFLRLVIETEEKRRKELLKGASSQNAEEEVGWDEGSDSDSPSTPVNNPQAHTTGKTATVPPSLNDSASTINPSAPKDPSQPSDSTLKPNEPRKSNDQHSQPDSDASYDLVSGATSRAPGSPKDEKEKEKVSPIAKGKTAEESDEEDWE